MVERVDTLIIAGWVIPVVPRGRVLENYAVCMRGDKIVALIPAAEADSYNAAEVIRLPEHVVLPGFINMHGHAALSLLRGYADDCSLLSFLYDYVWPAESTHSCPDFVRDGVDLAIVEMLRSGTTCFSDMYFFPDTVAERVQRAGMRGQVVFTIMDSPPTWSENADACITKGMAVWDKFRDNKLVTVVLGPHAPYSVSKSVFGRIAELSSEFNIPVHIHLHETADEVREAEQTNSHRPLATLHAMGLINAQTQCVHMTTLNDTEIELLADTGAHVIHCPESNMKISAGRCPVAKLQVAGVNIALGTDSPISNNDLSMLGEMRSAALLAKIGDNDPTVLSARKVLEMATINGAIALGRQEDLGSIETGKLADLIAIDFAQPETQPLYDPISQLVYATHAQQVTHTWVAGRCLMRERELTTLDLTSILKRVRDRAAGIAKTRPRYQSL